jgi:hypothetical protein
MKKTSSSKASGLVALARVAMALAVVLALFVQASPALAQDGGGGDGGSGGKIVDALAQVAKWFISVLIGIASILLGVGVITGFVGGQFMVTVGNPLGLSTAWMRVISVVLLGVLAILGVVISNEIVDIISGLGINSDIHVITP